MSYIYSFPLITLKVIWNIIQRSFISMALYLINIFYYMKILLYFQHNNCILYLSRRGLFSKDLREHLLQWNFLILASGVPDFALKYILKRNFLNTFWKQYMTYVSKRAWEFTQRWNNHNSAHLSQCQRILINYFVSLACCFNKV